MFTCTSEYEINTKHNTLRSMSQATSLIHQELFRCWLMWSHLHSRGRLTYKYNLTHFRSRCAWEFIRSGIGITQSQKGRLLWASIISGGHHDEQIRYSHDLSNKLDKNWLLHWYGHSSKNQVMTVGFVRPVNSFSLDVASARSADWTLASDNILLHQTCN